MENNQELTCGGHPNQDKIIKENMKILSEQDTSQQIEESVQKKCEKQKCENCECKPNQQNVKVQQKQVKINNKRVICKKCKLNQSALLHKNDPICKDCLLKNIEYKCRLTLQNSMKVQQKSSILLCFSGGLNSICLVSIMSSLKRRYQKHHLFGQLRCIHIKQQNNLPQNYKQIFEKQTGLQLKIINIGQVYEGEQNKNINNVREVLKMFNKAANTVDILNLMKDRLIIEYARNNKFDFIIKGLNGESIATAIFKYFAKGIGGEVTELSSREEDSLFHFPLRQHLQKQLQYYFYTNNLGKLSLKSQQDDLSNSCSSQLDQHLTDFILNLQTMYSHTAPAITRTSQKIQSNRKSQNRCKWCLLKNSFPPNQLCRKCDRILENKNKNYQNNKLPNWMKVHNL